MRRQEEKTPIDCNTRFSVSCYGKAVLAAIAAHLCATRAPAQTVSVNYGYSWLTAACTEKRVKQNPELIVSCFDLKGKYEDLVSRLNAQFAANPLCHGISFTQPGDETLPQQYWTLWLYPSPGTDSQSWILFKSGMKKDVSRGRASKGNRLRGLCRGRGPRRRDQGVKKRLRVAMIEANDFSRTPKGNNLLMMEATGTPSRIATHVCTIIKGSGGAIVR